MQPYDYWIVFIQIYLWPTIAIGGLAIGARLFSRYIKAIERRGEAKGEQAQLLARVAALEEALEDTQSGLTRLESAQEFTTRLLVERVDGRLPRNT